MDLHDAGEAILAMLRAQGRATNSEMLAAIGGDAALFARIREKLIVDDVATTGATLRACADVLLQNGAERVGALVGALS